MTNEYLPLLIENLQVACYFHMTSQEVIYLSIFIIQYLPYQHKLPQDHSWGENSPFESLRIKTLQNI